MVPAWIIKLATPLVGKLIKEKLGHVIGYVEDENELDVKCKELEKRIAKVERFTLKLKNKKYFKKEMEKQSKN